VDSPIGSFERQLAASRLTPSLFLTMHEDPTLQCLEAAKVEHDQPESEHLLTIGAALHRSEDSLEVTAHSPNIRPSRAKNRVVTVSVSYGNQVE
jgi:hypothetical protein